MIFRKRCFTLFLLLSLFAVAAADKAAAYGAVCGYRCRRYPADNAAYLRLAGNAHGNNPPAAGI